MRRLVVSLICLLAFPLVSCGPGASPPENVSVADQQPELEGVWQRAEIVWDSGPDAGVHMIDVQPSVYIFTKTHYGIAAIEGFQPRAYLDDEPTDADRGSVSRPYTGETGTYQNVDGKLVMSPLVSKDPDAMVGGAAHEYQIAWETPDVWLSTTSPDGAGVKIRLTRVDDRAGAASPAAVRLPGVWKRTEMVVGTGPDAGTHITDGQPGYYIFTRGAYVGTYVSSFAPRPSLGKAPTDEALGKNFTSFVSFAGAYSVKDDELSLTPVVAQNPNSMLGRRPFQAIGLKWAGEDAWLIYKSSTGAENRTRLVRVPD